MYELFTNGGIFMWPLLGLSVISIAVIFERIIAAIKFSFQCKEYIKHYELEEDKGFPLAGNLRKEALVQHHVDRFFSVIDIISGIGGIAPLLGFIGTVSGMIISFQSIAAEGKVEIHLVAAGISEALITTGFGLLIGALCVTADHLFRFFIQRHIHDLDIIHG